ncbi:MAG: hypothetical protein M0R75_11760 [Dehalococcoidia bacterium]|nr:hypothetical protein [Dehalococcoidia bacterium]
MDWEPSMDLTGDPVVFAGTKYRIRERADGREGVTYLVALAPKRKPTHSLTVDSLSWDRIAGVWRTDASATIKAVA